MPILLGDRGPIPCPLVSSRWKYDGDCDPVLIFFSFFSDGDSWFYVGFKRDLGSDTPSLCSSRSLIDRDFYPVHDSFRLDRWGLSNSLFGDAVLLFLWWTRPRPHPLMPRAVSSGGILSGVAGLCILVRGRRGAGVELNARESRLWTRA